MKPLEILYLSVIFLLLFFGVTFVFATDSHTTILIGAAALATDWILIHHWLERESCKPDSRHDNPDKQ